MFHADSLKLLEYPIILNQLADIARTSSAKERALNLKPLTDPNELSRMAAQTESARTIFDVMGAPPISSMEGHDMLMEKLRIGETLSIQELKNAAAFLNHCRLLKRFCERALTIDKLVAGYGMSIDPLTDIQTEIEGCIRGETVDDNASPQLRQIRTKLDVIGSRIKEKLSSLLRSHPEWFQEQFHSLRGGRYVLPVKREHRALVKGQVLDASSSGVTVFIEPASVQAMQQEMELLRIDEENEVYRILATLTSLLAASAQSIRINCDAMTDMDFAFACGRLGNAMGGITPQPTKRRELILISARHPMLGATAVPLTVTLGAVKGLIITGPNTGGKTVTLKTIGLLTLMALTGLQVPAKEAHIPLFSGVYCDIGDGQSITQNLSTFSSHVVRIVDILKQADGKSLVLLDELGSGTDPQEGMGLAVSVLEELGRRSCLLVATSHYPEIKHFAKNTPGFSNARMTFDRATLSPLYQLEMGEAGESCALYIAKRLGIPDNLLIRAWSAAYPNGIEKNTVLKLQPTQPITEPTPEPTRKTVVEEDMAVVVTPIKKPEPVGAKYKLGDSVYITFMKRHGIVYQERNARGEIGVKVLGNNLVIPEKRLKPFIAGKDLYPEGEYDLDIVLDTVENRKAKRDVRKGKEGAVSIIKAGKEIL